MSRYNFENDLEYLTGSEQMTLLSYKEKIKDRKELGEDWSEILRAERNEKAKEARKNRKNSRWAGYLKN